MVQNKKGEYYFQKDEDYADDIITGMLKILNPKKVKNQ
jgi:hypothetical protein